MQQSQCPLDTVKTLSWEDPLWKLQATVDEIRALPESVQRNAALLEAELKLRLCRASQSSSPRL